MIKKGKNSYYYINFAMITSAWYIVEIYYYYYHWAACMDDIYRNNALRCLLSVRLGNAWFCVFWFHFHYIALLQQCAATHNLWSCMRRSLPFLVDAHTHTHTLLIPDELFFLLCTFTRQIPRTYFFDASHFDWLTVVSVKVTGFSINVYNAEQLVYKDSYGHDLQRWCTHTLNNLMRIQF